MDQSEQIQQLVQSVQALTVSLNDERQQRLANYKRQRLVMVAALMMIMVTAWLTSPGISAQANPLDDLKKLETDVKMDIHEINKFFKNVNKLVAGLDAMLDMANASMKSPTGVLNDAGTLVTRIKQDSDVLRASMIKPGSGTSINSADASPAIMINNAGTMIHREMNMLNRIMGEMMHYVRSTLGRTSTWMNWMPTAP